MAYLDHSHIPNAHAVAEAKVMIVQSPWQSVADEISTGQLSHRLIER